MRIYPWEWKILLNVFKMPIWKDYTLGQIETCLLLIWPGLWLWWWPWCVFSVADRSQGEGTPWPQSCPWRLGWEPVVECGLGFTGNTVARAFCSRSLEKAEFPAHTQWWASHTLPAVVPRGPGEVSSLRSPHRGFFRECYKWPSLLPFLSRGSSFPAWVLYCSQRFFVTHKSLRGKFYLTWTVYSFYLT